MKIHLCILLFISRAIWRSVATVATIRYRNRFAILKITSCNTKEQTGSGLSPSSKVFSALDIREKYSVRFHCRKTRLFPNKAKGDCMKSEQKSEKAPQESAKWREIRINQMTDLQKNKSRKILAALLRAQLPVSKASFFVNENAEPENEANGG